MIPLDGEERVDVVVFKRTQGETRGFNGQRWHVPFRGCGDRNARVFQSRHISVLLFLPL
jgi:hypothetical protein